jgi:hypothetical protein
MTKPSQLFLLADHIKLSLLERQRATSLNLDSDTQDGHISRSLDQLRAGLESFEQEQQSGQGQENGTEYAPSEFLSVCHYANASWLLFQDWRIPSKVCDGS